MGGGTTRIGDPSGKDEIRQLLTDEQIAANMAGIRRCFEPFLDASATAPTDAIMANNADWLDALGYIPLLRDVGRALHRQPHADLRFGEAAAGARAAADLPRIQLHDPAELRFPRAEPPPRLRAADGRLGSVGQHRLPASSWRAAPTARRSFGLTTPLITTASGAKMGKTAQGAVWLTADRLSPSITGSSGATPRTPMSAASCACSPICRSTKSRGWSSLSGAEINEAKKLLATEATALLHGRRGGRGRQPRPRAAPSRKARRPTPCRVDRAGSEDRRRRHSGVPAVRAGRAGVEQRRGAAVDPRQWRALGRQGGRR